MSYSEALKDIMVRFRFELKDDFTLTAIIAAMQHECPGPYTLEWKNIDHSDGLNLRFTEAGLEVTAWLLKYA